MIELQHISKTFKKKDSALHAVEDVSLKIAPKSIVALIGPSGCGKSTLLNMIAGLYPPSQGRVFYDGHRVADVNTNVGYMTQKDNLLPWRTVLDNVAFPLEVAGMPQAERHEAARRLLALVGLSGFEMKYSHELSGGMRKRACLARMLIYKPNALLLDEPFAALDAQLRIAMHALLMRLWEEQQQTILFVTHDLVEAITLADRVVVFTRRPASIVLEQEIDLPRPRDVHEVRFTEPFHHIHNALWDRLRTQYDEVRL
ncbi:ABC transporter ATP-binding protein [Xanthobacter sp. KR7-65]|uniref:ABC transporter ATP-binding protein n=1 Tax=Xanthobacter sp. KR7-65 TaxID=3156612 RepID=UPI0032B4B791